MIIDADIDIDIDGFAKAKAKDHKPNKMMIGETRGQKRMVKRSLIPHWFRRY